jgi:SAM-dependent methyltransferase
MKWYESWFDSPYYHILYEHRDATEARQLIDRLLDFLQPPPGAQVLDVACGRGRHAVYLNSKGFDVTGFDLSEQNIAFDRRFESPTLHFFIHDMRRIFRRDAFDVVLNLFSSFGYFETEQEHADALASHGAALRSGGRLVLDYMNSDYIAGCMKEHESKTVEGITFHISRCLEKEFVVKSIAFTAGGRPQRFAEKLRLFSLDDFERMLGQTGLRLERVFGNYRLEPFAAQTSERMILVAAKP